MKMLFVDRRKMVDNLHGERQALPCIVVLHEDGRRDACRDVEILGPSRMCQDENPKKNGRPAAVWLETDSPLKMTS